MIGPAFFGLPFLKPEPLSDRMAYVWVGAHGPLKLEVRRFAREWRWPKSRAYRFVRRMLACGLFIQRGAEIHAAQPREAVPPTGYVVGESWESLRLRVFVRDGFTCAYCGSTRDLHCDHVVPRARGGLDVDTNLTTACRPCNLSKAAKLLEEWL